jgi:hypothetical protein
MAVFTIFCHGTNEHRSNGHSTEIIHALSARAAGTEYDQFLILDGPGIGVKSDQHNRMAGTFDAFDKGKGKKGDAPAWSKTSNTVMDVGSWERGNAPTWNPSTVKTTGGAFVGMMDAGKGGKAAGVVGLLLSPLTVPIGVAALQTDKARGLAYGEGMDDNIRHAMAAMGNKWPDFNGHTINMIGWSRGAVTCIRMANWIEEFFGSGVNVNIFAIDPVAGNDLGLEVADTYIIPPVVKNFIGLICMDDKRGGFKPQDINRLQVTDTKATHFALLPLPGSHDTPVKIGKDANLAEVAEVSRYMGYKFLLGQGSTFSTAETPYSAAQLAEKYASVKGKADGYGKLGKKGVGKAAMGGIIKRDVHIDLDRYISHNSSYFVNEHHVECFKAAFPQVYQLFFTASPPVPAAKARAASYSVAASSDLGRQLQAFYQEAPASCELLMVLGVLQRRSTGVLGSGPAFWTVKPAGLYTGDNGAMITGRALLRTLMG